MIQFGWDNPSPATVVLISSDRDFAYGVSVLRLRHYRVVIMAQSSIHDSLRCQASEFYDWDAMILGKQGPNGRSVDLSLRPPQTLPASRTHIRLPPVQPATPMSVQLPTSTGETSDGNHSSTICGPSPGSLAIVSSRHHPHSSNGSMPSRSTPLHVEESSTSERYAERRSVKSKEPWNSVGSSLSSSTFVR